MATPAAPEIQEPLSAEEFRAATDVSRETLDRLECYAALLEKWNRAINLASRASLTDLWRRHMLDSAQLWPLLPSLQERTQGRTQGQPRKVLDLGSGAGFPGLVLAIMAGTGGADDFHLVEADEKKAAFLREAARATETRIMLHDQRIETLRPFSVDVVTARACAPLPRLLDYAAPFLRPEPGRGHHPRGLFLKGRDFDRELTAAREKWKIQVEEIPSRTEPRARILQIELLPIGGNLP
jgi:16S rRNA (guanine527-N7)-methyltransferase